MWWRVRGRLWRRTAGASAVLESWLCQPRLLTPVLLQNRRAHITFTVEWMNELFQCPFVPLGDHGCFQTSTWSCDQWNIVPREHEHELDRTKLQDKELCGCRPNSNRIQRAIRSFSCNSCYHLTFEYQRNTYWFSFHRLPPRNLPFCLHYLMS